MLRELGLDFFCLSLYRRECKNHEYGVTEDQFVLNVDSVRAFLAAQAVN
jgi:hypothetical protein